jgi:hypothetical protein
VHRRVLLGVLVATLFAGCGGSTPAQTLVGGSELPKAWATFPVHTSPRPIVLVDSPVNLSAGFAFPDGPSKEAFGNGAVDPPAQLPGGPATAQGYPVISAAGAVALLQTASQGKPGTAGQRLRIASARFGEGTFLTDRGQKTMPAWLFSLAGIDGTVSVLAVAPSAQWLPPGSSPMAPPGRPDIGASLASDHRTLTLGFTGAQSDQGPCGERYTLQLTESATAVLATVITHRNDSNGICDLVGYRRTASARLQAPLGNRVVIEGSAGSVIAALGA